MAEQKLPFREHFKELRRVLMVSFGAVFVFAFVIYVLLREWVMELLTGPVKALGMSLIFTGVSEAFLAYIKVSLWAGIVVASPIILWQLLSFILPGLYAQERRKLLLTLAIGSLLFILGLLFGYFVVFPLALNALLFEFSGSMTSYLTIGNYLSFAFKFLIPFGLVFEIPLLVYALSDMELVTAKSMARVRKYILVVFLIIAAILTPPDIISQGLLAAPMMLLYEAGILVARLVERRKLKQNSLKEEADA